MAYVAITADNANNYPAGTKVRFNYGPMYGSEDGEVTGYRTTPFGTDLEAKTENGGIKHISGFSDIGIGVYLLED